MAQLMAFMKMTKEDIEEIMTSAVKLEGADAKEAARLTKEMLLEVQKAKVGSGFSQSRFKGTKSNEFQPDLRTQRTKSDIGYTHQMPMKEPMRREKTEAHGGYHNRSYLDSDDDIKFVRQAVPATPQRPRNAFMRSAEI